MKRPSIDFEWYMVSATAATAVGHLKCVCLKSWMITMLILPFHGYFHAANLAETMEAMESVNHLRKCRPIPLFFLTESIFRVPLRTQNTSINLANSLLPGFTSPHVKHPPLLLTAHCAQLSAALRLIYGSTPPSNPPPTPPSLSRSVRAMM